MSIQSHLSCWPFLSPNQQQLTLEHTRLAHYKRGEFIHIGSNDCIGMLFVKTGTLRAFMLSETGREITLYRLHAQDICVLSVSCALPQITFEVHIEAAENTSLYIVDSAFVSQLMKENLYFQNFCYEIILNKFSDVMWTMQQILFMRFDQRLAHFLLQESETQNTNTLSLTHDQIARYMGSAREVVSRMLKYFEGEGVLSLYRGGLTLIDPAKLKSYL